MADQSVAAAQGDGRPGVVAPFGFEQVLQHELAIVAARRERLEAQRGDLGGSGPSPHQDPTATAWQARLLGLSFSGGGIRSATFNLGVLQALAGRGLLRYVDYLSTVSGGGYIGSWLTALCQRRFARTVADAQDAGVETGSLLELSSAGFKSLEQGLAWSAGETDDSGPKVEDRAIRFLREYSNYLTPKLGLFSGDTWALIAIYVRNLLLNLLVLVLALFTVLLIPHLLSPLLARSEADNAVEFLLWMLAVLIVHVFVCWHLGRNLATITTLRRGEAEHAPRVLRRIGVPLLAIGVSGASWLGYVGMWSVPFAAAVGAAVGLFTWSLAAASARWHVRESWGDVEKGFWTRMVLYAAPAGALFGLLLHAVGAWLFTEGTYSGFKLVAAPPALAFAILLAGVLHIGLAGKSFNTHYSEWLSRFGGIVLIAMFAWIGFSILALLGPLIFTWVSRSLLAIVYAVSWALPTLFSALFGTKVVASSRTLARIFMTVAPYVFVIGLVIAASAFIQAGLHATTARFGDAASANVARDAFYARFEVGEDAIAGVTADGMRDYGAWLAATEDEWIVTAALALVLVLTSLVSLRIDVNVFSLNGMYANRLVRCYLGASVPERKPNRFSGLSARDDLQLKGEPRLIGGVHMLVHPLADGAKPGDDPREPRPVVYPGPYHLINTAINLVAGGNLAYQERKAGPFLLSPLYCGFQLDSASSEGPHDREIDAYRPTAEFSSQPRQLTLGEAVATSGAAASPNMGYHSTPAFAFLLGLFNIRLGRWVGNPHGSRGNENTWRKTGPTVALFHLLREVFGLTDKASGFVYLSDGGHFENLGIYELVRRRCRYIIACDAGADPRYGFEDLANAIRKCRTDLGVEIDLDVRQIAAADALRHNGAPCAVGSIRYSEEQVGTILYIKASRRAGVSSDVAHYAFEHAAFPHESTSDQFFSESQFESYRRLGHFLTREILATGRSVAARGLDVDRLFRDLSRQWRQPSAPIASNFGQLAEEVDELFERLRTSNELGFLSRQFYPEWRSLLGASVVDPDQQAADLVFLPSDEGDLRQGFYFCNSLIQLMERVFVTLNLETEWQHPDNTGWINVFNHWAWSGMFRATWAVSAATYGGRFRVFCEQRLNLTLGDVEATQVLEGAPTKSALASAGLNGHEQHQIGDPYVSGGGEIAVYRLELRVRHPINAAPPLMTFGIGYAVMRGDELVMYRVQDHLRGMGLGRRGLVALIKVRGGRALALGIRDVDRLLEFFARFSEQTDRAKLADFRALVVSVNEENATK